jgi:hypothetical protein
MTPREYWAVYLAQHPEVHEPGLRVTIAAPLPTRVVKVSPDPAPSARAAAPPQLAAPRPRTTLTAAEAMAVDTALSQVTQRIAAFKAVEEQRARQLADVARRLDELKRMQSRSPASMPEAGPSPPVDALTRWEQSVMRREEAQRQEERRWRL